MSEDLLLELRAAAPVAVDLEGLEEQGPALEQVWRVYLRQVSAAVQGMKGSGRAFEGIWRRIILDVAGGRTADIQADRPRLLAAFEKRLDLLRRTYALAGRLRRSHGAEAVPDPDVLQPEIAGLERLKAEVFGRWQTVEDLERLAVEYYPLSQAQLQEVAASHAPPAEWYAGDEELLFQE